MSSLIISNCHHSAITGFSCCLDSPISDASILISKDFMRFLRTFATLIHFSSRDINTVDNTMDDIREQMDLANEISDAISQPVGFGQEMDEVGVVAVNIQLVILRMNLLPSWSNWNKKNSTRSFLTPSLCHNEHQPPPPPSPVSSTNFLGYQRQNQVCAIVNLRKLFL